jgi:hypothetical protein
VVNIVVSHRNNLNFENMVNEDHGGGGGNAITYGTKSTILTIASLWETTKNFQVGRLTLILTFTFQGLLYAPSGLNMNKMLYFAH